MTCSPELRLRHSKPQRGMRALERSFLHITQVHNIEVLREVHASHRVWSDANAVQLLPERRRALAGTAPAAIAHAAVVVRESDECD